MGAKPGTAARRGRRGTGAWRLLSLGARGRAMNDQDGVVPLERRETSTATASAAAACLPASGFDQGAARRRVEQLLDAIRTHAGGRHAVMIRGYPDPDSLASAWAHARLAASIGVECDIVHMPLVSRAENRAMVNLLEMPLTRIGGPDDLARYKAVSLVDANSVESAAERGSPCVSIVDHHSVPGKLEADFIDIRPEVGATSTIYTEYLWSAPAPVRGGRHSRPASPPRSPTASAATRTICSARRGPTCTRSATSPSYVDADMLAGLLRYAIPASSMRIMRRALEEMEVEGTWAFAGVGEVRPQDRDAIGQAADFLMRRDGIRR